MTIAGQLSVTASDDPRFAAGDSIGIVIDPGLTLTVTQAVEVSAPVVVTDTAPPAPVDSSEGNPDSTPPATP